MDFSPDGQHIVSGGEDKTVRLWDQEGKPIVQPLQGHAELVTKVMFSPDGKRIISAGWDANIHIWDRNGKSMREPIAVHSDEINALAFSPAKTKLSLRVLMAGLS